MTSAIYVQKLKDRFAAERTRLVALKTGLGPALQVFPARLAARKRLLAGLAVVCLLLVLTRLMPLSAGLMALALFTVVLAVVAPAGEPWWSMEPARGSTAVGAQRAARVAHWRAVIDAMQDPALALDADGNVLHHSPAVADLFPRVRTGTPLTNMTRNPELIEAVERVSADEHRVVVELKDRVPVTRNITAIVNWLEESIADDSQDRRAPAIFIVFRDMTDHEKLAQMRADFVANASHELRTPLASLRGFVETLQGPARDDPVARVRFLGIMSVQAARMTQLIDDLLALSRAEMREHVPPRGTVDLCDVLSFVTQSLEPIAQANRTTLTLTTPDGQARVRGDRDELVQVFQNLVQNALKYGNPGGRVDVRMTRDPAGTGHGRRIAVSVVDDGPGIAPEHLPRLTERFYRVNVTQSREKGGTGLGLAIVKYIVNRHRGELKVASELGKGSTFSVHLEELPQGAN